MLLGKLKRIVIALFVVFFTAEVFAATTDLAVRFLDKANEAYEDGNVEDAYKYVNQALAVAKDEASQTNVLYFAQTVYKQKLINLQNKYDDMALIDIKMNLEKYPNIENTTIKKLVKQIEQDQENKEKAAQKAETAAQRKVEQERFEAQQESMDAQAKAMKEQADAMKEQAEATKQSQKEFKDALESGLKDMGNTFTDAFSETAKETKRSTRVIAFSIIGIAIIIVFLVLLIMVIIRKAAKANIMQQEQYAQAFKLLAQNQSQTNRIMLGGITDIYGGNPSLRIAGSSTWAPAQALPDVTFSEEDEEELKQLAVKCEEIGQQIDNVTGRKNNSKNVSELVYKLSIQLGLPQGMAMLNFCAAMIYDAGFLAIDPDLLVATQLTEEEKHALNEHVNLAEKHLEFVPKKYWSVFEDAATKHHENIDGSGYPNGISGDEIPQIARLIRVAETYVSLSSKRAYRGAMDKETAVNTLKEQPGLYDQEVVEALDKIV
ncbi:HD domain-containing protein [Treponema bryantii]|uniref:HD domain-containing protein n=1 Tax=Treponema bryantii TaxID=163 RepID=A0A1I3I6P0_9SPIR|nr:HD domain-containing phosphohydrolase [Treponema bryantii]SFI43559.1 HD domain-containing protein [Treponema bryantii]